MAGEFFVDTSAWYPAVVQSHPDHQRVAAGLAARIRQKRRVVTTNLVIAETHALLLRRAGSDPALTFAKTVRLPPNLIVWADARLDMAALSDWLERYDDQDFSLTDAVSFAVMQDRGIEEALTLDRHFAVAGFRVAPET